MASKLLRRRRVFRLIAFLTVAGVIFVCFQIFSMEMLNKSENESNRMHLVGRQSDNGNVNVVNNNKPRDCLNNPRNCDIAHNASNAVIQADNRLYLNHAGLDNRFNMDVDIRDNLAANNGYRDYHGANNRPVKQDHFKLNDDVVKQDDIDSYEDFNQNGKIDYRLSDNDDKAQEQNDYRDDFDESSLPRGVPRTMAKLYSLDQNSMFTCLQSKERISWSLVNDDYCDCADSSDEPGTSACPDARFYCKFQLHHSYDLKSIHSSKVNDGICDCCDGSDEWQNVSLDDRLVLKDGGAVHYGIRQAPCQDRCAQLQAEVQQRSARDKRGAEMKYKYLSNLSIGRARNKLYGVDGAYFMLAEECFSRSADKYQYTVCPFQHVKQSNGRDSKVIGKNGAWLDARRLKMTGGDSTQCPGLRHRVTILEFECSTENQVLSIQETEVCEYTIRFSTPAAC